MRKIVPFLIVSFVIVALVGCGPKAENPPAEQASAAPAQAPEKVGPFGILHRGSATDIPEPAALSASEAKRKEIALRLDKEKLLESFKVVEDRSEEMLRAPENIRPFVGKDIVMAKEPPAVEFAIVPARPLFFAEPPAGNTVGPWSNWSQAAFHEKTGRFYSSVGDHGAYDAHTYIVEYDPAAKSLRCLPEINHVLGRTAAVFGEGKIHGWLNFYPQGSSNLWFCTYWCKYPEPAEEDFATGYDGGHIMSLNVETGDPDQYFIKYDPAKNRVVKLAARMPMQPAFGPHLPARRSQMRAQTAHRGPDGLFWGVSRDGELFTFDPVKEEVADKGVNWPGQEKYTCSMARSPKGRYVYYLPGAHGLSWKDGSLIIQYDTATGTKKALAFLHPYFHEKYGYTMGGTFSITLDADGARLFVLMNGGFVDLADQAKAPDEGIFGHCSALLINIPESERAE